MFTERIMSVHASAGPLLPSMEENTDVPEKNWIFCSETPTIKNDWN